MPNTDIVPVFQQGLDRVGLAIKAKAPLRRSVLDTGTWNDRYLLPEPQCRAITSLKDLGIHDSPIGVGNCQNISAIRDKVRLFTPEGAERLRASCNRIEEHSAESDWIISNRTRAATQSSAFIDGMMNSRRFLLAVSKVAGLPLIPHPMVNARSQVNYFYPRNKKDDQQQIGRWHTDGTSFVLNILLTPSTEFSGGSFLYFNAEKEKFPRHRGDDGFVIRSRISDIGDAAYIYGSQVFHAVEPIESGRRMSLVLSFHCPYTGTDANRFWHLASDDGIPATIRNWTKLKLDLRKSAARQFEEIGVAPITFEEIHG